jgi:selenium metabolism protein YedF
MAINPKFLLVLKSAGLGDGELDLSETLLDKFLTVLYESGELPARIICMNSAIFLTTGASRYIPIMTKFHDAGTEIFSCGTCLEYYGKADQLKIGVVGNMKDSVGAMLSFEKVISL